jgi:hypothetical protein
VIQTYGGCAFGHYALGACRRGRLHYAVLLRGFITISPGMRRRRTTYSLPGMLTALGIASAQTIALRAAMMAAGTCTAAEYRRMVREKATAALQTSLKAASWPPASATALLTPWHNKAAANAKRLRRRRRR